MIRLRYLLMAVLAGAAGIAALQWQTDTEAVPEPVPESDTPVVLASPIAETVDVVQPPEAAPRLTPESPDEPVEEGAATPVAEIAVGPKLPLLVESDPFVRAEMAGWSLPEGWLSRNDLLPRAATLLVNLADGHIPNRQITHVVPSTPYPVRTIGDRYFVEPQGYLRYAPYLDVLEQVPPSELAGFLVRIDPLLTQALAQLGVRDQPKMLVQAAIARVDQMARLPISGDPQGIELLRPSVMYTYADPDLEALSALEKQLLRIGPANVRRLRAYLLELRRYY